ncbi:hypothetical protein [Paenibacillus sp. Marseille-Q4541]|uniref:hypothetical protein n=1 Tax=Paenibacillus sp. Marseille-Q4541 TaxID=2831522 RepID=UPI001BA788C2|nr:hypothetical protein [Paenibacillus sp. Marseille-Q4541]
MGVGKWITVGVACILLVLPGCSEEEIPIIKEGVSSIRLECVQVCLESQKAPFIVKMIEDQEEIERFVHEVNQSEAMLGMVDYAAIFEMTVNYDEGAAHRFHINVSDEIGRTGLLVDLDGHSNTNAYEIPEDAYDELSRLIYDNAE